MASISMLSIVLIFMLIVFDLATLQSAPVTWETLNGSEECQRYLKKVGFVNATTAFEEQRGHLDSTGNRTSLFPTMILIGDSTLQNKRDWVVEILGATQSVPFMMRIGKKSCGWVRYALNKMKRKDAAVAADLVLWNDGLHAQQLFPAVRTGLHSLHEYEEQLNCYADAIVEAFPTKPIYYKLTNRVCHNKFVGKHQFAAAAWYSTPDAVMKPEYEMQMTAAGTEFINFIERRLPRRYNFTLVNHWVTGACDCTASMDGRHYSPIVPEFWRKFLQLHREKAAHW